MIKTDYHLTPKKLAAVGHACSLMAFSLRHKQLFLSDLEWVLYPPIYLDQYKLWAAKANPETGGPMKITPEDMQANGDEKSEDMKLFLLGYASWAFVSPEIDQRLRQGGDPKLRSGEWKSGDICWLMDLVAHPALQAQGGAEKLFEELKNGPLQGIDVQTPAGAK